MIPHTQEEQPAEHPAEHPAEQPAGSDVPKSYNFLIISAKAGLSHFSNTRIFCPLLKCLFQTSHITLIESKTLIDILIHQRIRYLASNCIYQSFPPAASTTPGTSQGPFHHACFPLNYSVAHLHRTLELNPALGY